MTAPLLALMVLCGLGQPQAGSQDPRVFHVGPELVNLKFPMPAIDSLPSAEITSWSGWSGLAGPNPTFDSPYLSSGDWSGVEKAYLASATAAAPTWHLKIVLIASTDTLFTHADGVLEDRRSTIMGSRFLETLDAIPQFVALVSSVTGGKLKVVPDVLIDPEPSRDAVSAGTLDFDDAYLRHYLEGRINGGRYDADDKLFRGPFNSVLFVDPFARYSPKLTDPAARITFGTFRIANSPTAQVSFDSAGGGSEPGALAVSLLDAWSATVTDRALEKGMAAPNDSLSNVDWAELCDTQDTGTDSLLARLAKKSGSKPAAPTIPDALFRSAYKSANVKLALVKDSSSKAEVLEYSESSATRAGGVVLPHGATPINVGATPSFSFSYKTSSDRPLSVAFHDASGVTHWVSLGRDPEPSDSQIPAATSLPLQNDGTWHSIIIDLKSFGAKQIDQIRIGASPSSQVLTSDLSTPVVYDFTDFKLVSESPTPLLPTATASFTSKDDEDRGLAAIQAAKKGTATPELRNLLADPNANVVLNAAAGFRSIVDPAAEPKLIELAASPAPRISEMALRALDFQKTPAAQAAVEYALRSGFEYSREVAAGLIAAKHDPKSAEQLVVLLAGRLWHTRLASAEALAQIPGKPSGIMRLAMLQQEDPIIKVAVIEHTDPTDEIQMRKLLWTAVNETSDLVRAKADEKLIVSEIPGMQAEGLKGVRDDSVWTRELVLGFIQAHPSVAARSAVRLALTDPSSRVRAKALEALQGFDGVDLDEIKSCLTDRTPCVDLALIALAKLKKLALPPTTLSMLESSPDPVVVAAIK